MKTEHRIRTIGTTLMLLAFIVGTALPVWAEKEPYKVGCNFSLTGGFAMFTGIIKKALILEQERVNAQGGIDGHPIELIFEDSGQDITKMANINR